MPIDEAQVAAVYEGRLYVFMPNSGSWIWDGPLQEDYFVSSPEMHFVEVSANFAMSVASALQPYSDLIFRMTSREAGPDGVLPLSAIGGPLPTIARLSRTVLNARLRAMKGSSSAIFTVRDEAKFAANFIPKRRKYIKALVGVEPLPSDKRSDSSKPPHRYVIRKRRIGVGREVTEVRGLDVLAIGERDGYLGLDMKNLRGPSVNIDASPLKGFTAEPMQAKKNKKNSTQRPLVSHDDLEQ
ncbi:hypothetical protein HC749_08740 [Arthrobacter sp. S13_S34]|nr:hypothetical protein [Arthrobacter sp. S13_S34]